MGREYLANMIWAKCQVAIRRGIQASTIATILRELANQIEQTY